MAGVAVHRWPQRTGVALTLAVIACGAGASCAAALPSPVFLPLPTTASSQLQTARHGAVAAPLPDGEVLIAGGSNASGDLRSAELFDPVDQTFTALSSELNTPRLAAVAAPLPDGGVLIAGGLDSGGELQSAALFGPSGGAEGSDHFVALAASGNTELQTARAYAVAAPLPSGKVLIAGGIDGSGNVLRSAELFDPTTDTFTALPASGATELPGPVALGVAAPLPDGKVLIAGGSSDASTPMQSAELFDPTTNTFTALPASGATELQTARELAAAAPLPDGKVLIVGGDGQGGRLRSGELFDPATSAFAALRVVTGDQLGTARESPIAAPLPDGTVLIAGGDDPADLASGELFFDAPEAAGAGGQFGDQTIAEASTAQALVVTSLAAQPLAVTATAVTGDDAADFAIVSDSCLGQKLALGQQCSILTRFTPGAVGARSATLTLADNEPTPATIALSGTGIAKPSGESPGAAGKLELVGCKTIKKTVTKHHKRHKVKQQLCTAKVVSSNGAFTTAAASATLARGRVVYATGTAKDGQLVLHSTKRLHAGLYTLVLRRKSRHESITTTEGITLQ
jgi:WD40 repeat protein